MKTAAVLFACELEVGIEGGGWEALKLLVQTKKYLCTNKWLFVVLILSLAVFYNLPVRATVPRKII